MMFRSSRNPASAAGLWTKKANPLLTIGSGEVNNSWAIAFLDGSTYHMLYSYQVDGADVIGHATASDPEGTWTKDAAHNPVMSPGSAGAWDDTRIYVADFWKEDSTWYMLYVGVKSDGASKIGLATASDPAGAWTKSGSNPVLAGSETWEKDGSLSCLDCGPVIKVGSTYYFYYGTWMNTPRSVGVATSTNLTTWTKLYSTPLFTDYRYTCGGGVRGNYYYLGVSHYTKASQYSDVELWRSLSPAFTNPELVRVIGKYDPDISWQAKDFEMVTLISSSIEKNVYPDNKLRVLFSSSDVSDVWRLGMIVESDIDAALEMV